MLLLLSLLFASILTSSSAFSGPSTTSRSHRAAVKHLDGKSSTQLYSIVSELINNNPPWENNDEAAVDVPRKAPHLVFPGGGLFFYWQAGVVTYLREQGYDLDQMTASGASAGALTATLTATNVDFIKATELALKMAKEAGVWDRSGGLQGIW